LCQLVVIERTAPAVDGNLVDPHPAALCEEQQLGVEEPPVVGDQRHERARDVGADRLEAALRVGEARAEPRMHERVVAAREHLALEPPAHVGVVREPRPDRDLAVSGRDGRDERQEARQVRRQVDVHVREHVGVAREPRSAQRVTAALAREQDGLDVLVSPRERARELGRSVCARVVGDQDAGVEREVRAQVVDERLEALLEHHRLVVHRQDDVDARVWRGMHVPHRTRAG